MQTLSALAHYDRDARHSYEEAFLVMQNLGLDNAALGQMYSNNPESRWINRHQMSLCGKCDGHTAGDFVKLAKFAGIRHYAEIIEQVREAVALNEVSNPQFLIKNADCIPQKM